MNHTISKIVVGALFVGASLSANAAMQTGVAQHFTFQWEDSFWSLVSTVGDSLTFNNLSSSTSVPLGDGTGYTIDEHGYKVSTFSSNFDKLPVFVLTAKTGFDFSSLNFGYTGHDSLAGTAEFGSEMGIYQYTVDVPYSTDAVGSRSKPGHGSSTFESSSSDVAISGNQFTGTAWFWGKAAAYGNASSASVALDTAYLNLSLVESSGPTAVPEADTAMMMLAGLGMMGFVVARRR